MKVHYDDGDNFAACSMVRGLKTTTHCDDVSCLNCIDEKIELHEERLDYWTKRRDEVKEMKDE